MTIKQAAVAAAIAAAAVGGAVATRRALSTPNIDVDGVYSRHPDGKRLREALEHQHVFIQNPYCSPPPCNAAQAAEADGP